METILKIENLKVDFTSRESTGGAKHAVRNLNLSVNAGEVFGFLGPNGAGKTTTMNVLLGFVNPTGGAAYLFGTNVREPIARQRIGYLPDLTYYYKFPTAEELLRFYGRIFGIPKAELERRIDSVLKLVELDHARKRPIKTYSKGMQQRAAWLARFAAQCGTVLLPGDDLPRHNSRIVVADPQGKIRQILKGNEWTGAQLAR